MPYTIKLSTDHNRKKAKSHAEFNYQSLIDSIEGIVWEANAATMEFRILSSKVTEITGYDAEEWLTTEHFWETHIYEQDKERVRLFLDTLLSERHSNTIDYRMVKPDGSIVWLKDVVSVVEELGQTRWFRGIMVDVTASKLLLDLDRLEKEILTLAYDKTISINTLLNRYVAGLEGLFPLWSCSIMGMKDGRMFSWASASLPTSYFHSLNGAEIGPEQGSCGTAAYLKIPIIVTDITHDKKWDNFRHLALPHGLRACWSFPIIDSNGTVMAAFAIYYKTEKTPGKEELDIIERSSNILRIVLENRLFGDRMAEMASMMSQGQQLANFGIWQWELNNNKVSWSDILYDIYGLDKKSQPATFEAYLSRVHAEDRDRVKQIITDSASTGKDMVFEERIVRPNGIVRHLRSWGRVVKDAQGNPEKMIGACLDITPTKDNEVKMQQIAWLQSHVVRAPLARLIGLVNLLYSDLPKGTENDELVESLLTTASEIDQVIRAISNNTYV